MGGSILGVTVRGRELLRGDNLTTPRSPTEGGAASRYSRCQVNPDWWAKKSKRHSRVWTFILQHLWILHLIILFGLHFGEAYGSKYSHCGTEVSLNESVLSAFKIDSERFNL